MKFHILDILSISTGKRLLFDMDGVIAALNFLTGEKLFSHQLSRAARTCEPYLLRTYPVLSTPQVDLAMVKITAILEHLEQKNASNDEKFLVVKGWAATYIFPIIGQYIEILPLDRPYLSMDPMEELTFVKGDTENILVIRNP
jgi:hypothetical protein